MIFRSFRKRNSSFKEHEYRLFRVDLFWNSPKTTRPLIGRLHEHWLSELGFLGFWDGLGNLRSVSYNSTIVSKVTFNPRAHGNYPNDLGYSVERRGQFMSYHKLSRALFIGTEMND